MPPLLDLADEDDVLIHKPDVTEQVLCVEIANIWTGASIWRSDGLRRVDVSVEEADTQVRTILEHWLDGRYWSDLTVIFCEAENIMLAKSRARRR